MRGDNFWIFTLTKQSGYRYKQPVVEYCRVQLVVAIHDIVSRSFLGGETTSSPRRLYAENLQREPNFALLCEYCPRDSRYSAPSFDRRVSHDFDFAS